MLRWKALLWNEVSLHIYFLRGLVSCRRGQRTNSLGKSSTTKSLQYLPKYSRISFCYLSSQYFVVIIASPCYFYAKESDFRCWCRWFENTLSPSEGKGQAVNTARCTHDKHCWQLLTHICHRYVNCCLPEMGTVWPRSKGVRWVHRPLGWAVRSGLKGGWGGAVGLLLASALSCQVFRVWTSHSALTGWYVVLVSGTDWGSFCIMCTVNCTAVSGRKVRLPNYCLPEKTALKLKQLAGLERSSEILL